MAARVRRTPPSRRALYKPRRDLERQPGFTDSADAVQADQAGQADEVVLLLDVTMSPHEAAEREREVVLWGLKRCGECGSFAPTPTSGWIRIG